METLQSLVDRFLESCPPDFDYPLGGGVAIPLPSESRLLDCCMDGGELTSSDVYEMRQKLSRNDAYTLAIFALRMAVLSVERKQCRLLECCFWALLIDDDQLDWRDVLVSLSIIEDCLSRLGGDIEGLILSHVAITTGRRKKTLLEGYLKRSPEMRHVETMGYKAIQAADGGLRYFKCF